MFRRSYTASTHSRHTCNKHGLYVLRPNSLMTRLSHASPSTSERLGAIVEHWPKAFCANFSPSWHIDIGHIGAILDLAWGRSGLAWAIFARALGAIFGPSWCGRAIFGQPYSHLGAALRPLGPSSRALGAILEPSWCDRAIFGSISGPLGNCSNHLSML